MGSESGAGRAGKADLGGDGTLENRGDDGMPGDLGAGLVVEPVLGRLSLTSSFTKAIVQLKGAVDPLIQSRRLLTKRKFIFKRVIESIVKRSTQGYFIPSGLLC